MSRISILAWRPLLLTAILATMPAAADSQSDSSAAPQSAPEAQAFTPPAPIASTVEGNGVRLVLSIPGDHFQAGQTIPVTLVVHRPAGTTFKIDAPQGTHGKFDVRDVIRGGELGLGNARIDLATYETGTVEVPPITLHYTTADGAEGELATEATPIQVLSTLDGTFDRNKFRDIKGLAAIDTGWGLAWYWIFALLAAAGALAWWKLRSRVEVPVPVPAPHEWALNQLEVLASESLPARQEYQPYWIRLSGILREYVDRRFGVAAPDRTTKEFLEELRDHPDFVDGQRTTIAAFLRTADRVKFAAGIPALDECERGLSIARKFVDETRPIAEAPIEPPTMAGVPASARESIR